MNRLYQWLRERAIDLRPETATRGTHRTVHTEVTVQQRLRTVLLTGHATDAAAGSACCPLCGQTLKPVEAVDPVPVTLIAAPAALPFASPHVAPTTIDSKQA